MNTISHIRTMATVVLVSFAVLAAGLLGRAPLAHAQSASTTPDFPGMSALPDAGDFSSTLSRIRSRVALKTGATTIGSASIPNVRDITPDVREILAAVATSSNASTSTSGLGSTITDAVNDAMGSSTGSGLGEAIADAITGGSDGTGTSDIGPFIKCVLLSGIGWPIPTYATECPIDTTTPPTKGTLTIVKNTIGGNGDFGFTLSGHGSATTTLSTSGGTASVDFILDPGIFTIAEDLFATSTWSQTGRGCILNATTTGSTSGELGWRFSISAGQHITCTFMNAATSTSATTPPGGDGCVENCGGGGPPGCVSNCGDGGNLPDSDVSPGGNGRIIGGGGFAPGEVAGESISVPDIASPGVPNTGRGGAVNTTLIALLISLAFMTSGAWSIYATRR